MSNALMDILGLAGNVLDTPGSVLRGLASGQADRAFGGILDPSQRVSGRDMLDRWGVTDENSGTMGDLAGTAAQLATDPLTWMGTGLLGRALGRGAGALKAGRAVEDVQAAHRAAQVAEAAPKAETLLASAPGLTGYRRLADGTIQRLEAGPLTHGSQFGSDGTRMFGGGAGQISDAEQWTGRRAAMATPGTLTTDFGHAGSTGPVGDLLGLRRQMTVARDMQLGPTGQLEATFTGGMNAGNSAARAHQVMNGTQSIAGDMADVASQGGRLYGEYDPATRVAGIASDAPAATRAHEVIHGITDVARKTGGIDALPSGQLRNAARMQNTDSPLQRALGMMSEESVAHGRSAGRGTMNNLRGQMGFLSNPLDHYADQYARTSPLVGALYSSSAIPRLGIAGYGAGVGGLAALLGGSE